MKKILLSIIGAGLFVAVGNGLVWATLIDLNNGVTLDDRNTQSTLDDDYWIQDLDMFAGLTYDQQITAISNLSIAGLTNVTWHMATYADLLSLEALYPLSEIDDVFIPNGLSTGGLPHWSGRYDRVLTSSNPNPPHTYHYEVNMWSVLDPTYGEITMWGLNVGVADSETFPGAFVVGNVAPAPVPEPTTMLLLGTGIVALAGTRIRYRRINRRT